MTVTATTLTYTDQLLRYNSMSKLVIIDQGVDAGHDRLRSCQLTEQTVYQRADGRFVHKTDVSNDVTGHGTAVAGIIHRLVPGQPLHSLKMAAHNDVITEELLIETLRTCLTIKGARIINLSMGIATNSPSDALRSVCEQLQTAGIVLVAAVHNFPALDCYPAFFDTVYGVGCGLVSNRRLFGYLGTGYTNVLAKGTSQRVIWKDNSYKITSGTSFATAHFSGLLAGLLTSCPDRSPASVHALLAAHADTTVQELTYHKAAQPGSEERLSPADAQAAGQQLFTNAGQLPHAEQIALFPATGKEMNTLLEFKDILPFKLTTAIDFPRFLSNSLQLKLQQHSGLTLLRRDLLDPEYDSFDTLALGYFLDVPVDANILFATRLIARCIERNKHFVVLDRAVEAFVRQLIPTHNPAYSGHISLVGVTTALPGQLRQLGMLPPVAVPVVAVVGTGSKQGKLTIQLQLKHLLQKEGYRVSHVATEPHGLLLGADYVFPYGYKGNVELELTEWSTTLNRILRGVDAYNKPHLIVTGIQGGILPRTKRLFEQQTGSVLTSLHYLLGIQPDAVVCAVNPTDSPEHIQHTIDTVRNFCKAETLFCAMTPVSRTIQQYSQHLYTESELLSPVELLGLMAQREAELGLPVLNIMDSTASERILTAIQNHFAPEPACAAVL
jgi:hypothetical protein